MDLLQSEGEGGDGEPPGNKFDSCGAMDLSSSCSSSLHGEEEKDELSLEDYYTREKIEEENPSRKRKNEEKGETSNPKPRNKRKNIKGVMSDADLMVETKTAQEEEQERLARLVANQKQRFMEGFRDAFDRTLKNEEIISSDSSEDEGNKELVTVPSSDSDECRIVSDEADDDDDEDPNNSGMHVNDATNVHDANGRVLVNPGHSARDDDIFLASQISACIKPHQIGGLRFLYDNIIESPSLVSNSPGFGCILAHNMGLGKTMQIVSFVDLFLGVTDAKKVLCIVPINTIQNWVAEFNYWLPAKGIHSKISEKCSSIKHRTFPIYALNDSLKNLTQRSAVIASWHRDGGVLLMGYELYRQLANQRPRRRKVKGGLDCIDLEEEDKNKLTLDDIKRALVNPGPDLVVCDEGHRIKNSHASISQALKIIKTRRRIVLTGYPLQNNLMEYWCMVDFVRPNFLGNKTEFSNMFERPIQNGQCIDSTPKDVRLMKHRAHVLHEQLKGFVQRRGHLVLKDSLPMKREHVLFIRLTEIQRRLYKRFMEELITNRCVSNPLKAFAVCCKIWNHPDVLYNFLKKKEELDIDFDPEEIVMKGKGAKGEFEMSLLVDGKKEEINYDWAQGMLSGYQAEKVEFSNKLQVFLAILEESVKYGDRLLLFSQSLCTLNLIENFLQKRTVPNSQEHWKNGANYYRLDGSTSALERERLINSFNIDQRFKLFLVSTRAGSLGVNLVGANRVVIFDASWNPCHDTQAVCRVYRYGQTKETHVYRLVTDNSLEKKIYDRQINKQGMSDRIVDEMNPDAHLSSKEVHSLICDEDEDPVVEDMTQYLEGFEDPVMKQIISKFGHMLTKLPFSHESLLVDRQDNKLSKYEKKLAERAYKMEKTSKISYSRPSYAAFYPKQGSFATNLHNPGANGFTRNRYYENGKRLDSWISPYGGIPGARPVASVRPVPLDSDFGSSANQFSPHQLSEFENIPNLNPTLEKDRNGPLSSTLNEPSPGTSLSGSVQTPTSKNITQGRTHLNMEEPQRKIINANSAMEALSRQGFGMEQVKVPRDLIIPTNPSEPPIHLKAGENITVIRTPKGVYLKVGEKIIKIRQQGAVNSLYGGLAAPTLPPSSTENSTPDLIVESNSG